MRHLITLTILAALAVTVQAQTVYVAVSASGQVLAVGTQTQTIAGATWYAGSPRAVTETVPAGSICFGLDGSQYYCTPFLSVSADRQEVYDDLIGLWTTAGIGSVPATYDAAISGLQTWVSGSTDLATYMARASVKDRIMARRIQMLEHDWPWSEFLAYVARQ